MVRPTSNCCNSAFQSRSAASACPRGCWEFHSKKMGMLWMDQNVWISSTSYFGLFGGEQQRTMGFEGHLGERIPSRQWRFSKEIPKNFPCTPVPFRLHSLVLWSIVGGGWCFPGWVPGTSRSRHPFLLHVSVARPGTPESAQAGGRPPQCLRVCGLEAHREEIVFICQWCQCSLIYLTLWCVLNSKLRGH